MRLIIGIPTAAVRERPSLFLLMLAACAETEGDRIAGETVATLDDFPAQLDLALDLVEAVSQLRPARATMNGRPVADLNRLWSTLSCYRDSLAEAAPQDYCRRRASRVGEAGGCPAHACASPCPFICARCFQLVGKQDETPAADCLHRIAVEAEVDWCPNLSLCCSDAIEGSSQG